MKGTDSITTIKGVGEKTATLFKKLFINNVYELINYFPREYFRYEVPVNINELYEGCVFSIEANIVTSPELKRKGNRQSITCTVKDPSGTLRVTWYNQPYIARQLKIGYRMIFRGKVSRRGNLLVMEQPKFYTRDEYRKLCGVLQPVYPLTEGLTNNAVSKAVATALNQIEDYEDFVPRKISRKYGLIKREDAIREIHFPKSTETMQAARTRLAFDELFSFLIVLRVSRLSREKIDNNYIIKWDKSCDDLLNRLPYRLTGAQTRVLNEIREDLTADTPACRLIQGDVGSGKTILAIFALFMTALNGYQGCIMAPTEVLARQHFRLINELLKPYGINTVLLTGSLTAKERKSIYEQIADGSADIIVGTNALIQTGVEYKNLALVITDEQHRFGVRQRAALGGKGNYPHTFYMTATPIPRTLAILLYGDMRLSIIDELPADRLKIKNCVVDSSYRSKAISFITQQVKQGRQAYIICPMVEESESIDAENVIEYTQMLKEQLPADITTTCLHGKMKPAEKNSIMSRFEQGEIDVLVSTTVVEVGVNVPNATVMVIENSERFGLAQLHQLRGRVGRGEYQSYCIFISGNPSKETMERLGIMQKTNDGFKIAEADMQTRGPGDMLGVRQSGDMEFVVADIYRDTEALYNAKEAVESMNLEELESVFNSLDIMSKTENLRF